MELRHEEFYNKLNDFIRKNNSTMSFDGEDKVSSILLFKDFMWRLNLWKSELNTSFNNFDRYDLNLFNDVEPELMTSFENYDVYDDYIRTNFENYNRRNFVYFFIYLYVNWELSKDLKAIKQFSYLENPYESVVKIFANKNMIYKREGVNVSNVTMRDFNKSFKLPSIDDGFLTYLDSKCKLSGSVGIPNQERVNQLWKEFNNTL